MSISITTTSPNQAGLINGPGQHGEMRKARNALGDALASDSLEAAKAMFSQFAATTGADRAERHPDGAFARLQAALQNGDLAAAKAAYDKLPGVRKLTLGGEDLAVRSGSNGSGDGTMGRLLDVSA
jgi:hypothetical protein